MFIDTTRHNSADAVVENIPLPFSSRCDQCFGIGYRIAPAGNVEACPRIQLLDEAHEVTEAGKIIEHAIKLLVHRGLPVDPLHFDVARTLAGGTFEEPCSNDILVRRHFSYVTGSDERQRREVAKAIRFLREIWFLPVGSRKDQPNGYWICTSEEDFKRYFQRATSEPITTLSTLHRMAAANWPVFAEQIELDFFRDFKANGVRDFLAKTDAALEFIPEGSAIPYDVGTSGITLSDASDAPPLPELSR